MKGKTNRRRRKSGKRKRERESRREERTQKTGPGGSQTDFSII
jgi:hypothetical protein